MIVDKERRKTTPGCRMQRQAGLLICFAACSLFVHVQQSPASRSSGSISGITKAAADSCDAKIKRLEANDTGGKAITSQTIRFSDAEWNSYLAIVLKPNYHPSLQDVQLKFEPDRLQAFATVDFDKLSLNSAGSVSSLIRSMLNGVHTLTVWGRLSSDSGKASFALDEARFDTVKLPNLLVAEILSAVGRRQNPPIDPMQPNELPYHIKTIGVHSGYIEVVQ